MSELPKDYPPAYVALNLEMIASAFEQRDLSSLNSAGVAAVCRRAAAIIDPLLSVFDAPVVEENIPEGVGEG